MHPADKGEVAVALAGRVELARVRELRRIEIARGVEALEGIARLHLAAVPFEIHLRTARRGEDRLGAKEFLDRFGNPLRVLDDPVLNPRLERHAPEHLADGGGNGIEPAKPEEPDHADLFLVGQVTPLDLAVDDGRDQPAIGVGLLLGHEAAQEIEDRAQGPLGLFQRFPVEDVPFPFEEIVELFGWKAHQVHEDPHREDPPEIIGDINFALGADLLDHVHADFADRIHHPVEPRRREVRHEEQAILRVLGRIDGDRDRTERLTNHPLEFGSALVREMLVIGIDPLDVLVVRNYPSAALATGGIGLVAARKLGRARRVVEQTRNALARKEGAGLIGIDQIVGLHAHREGQVHLAIGGHVIRRGPIDPDIVERLRKCHRFLPRRKLPPARAKGKSQRRLSPSLQTDAVNVLRSASGRAP